MRSFSEPVGFCPSSLAQILTRGLGESLEMPTRGVLPTSPVMSSKRTEEELASRTRRRRPEGSPGRRRPRDDIATAVDERGEEYDARQPEPVAEPPREDRRDDVAGCDGTEDRRRDRLRLVQPVDDVQDDERARRGERSLPRRVGDQEAPHLRLLDEDAPAALEVRADAFEHAAVSPVLRHQEDRRAARAGRDECGQHERRRMPDLEQEAAADERRTERDAAQHVLDPLRTPVRRRRQQVGIETAVRRLVHVVREEEREDDRPEVRHEGHEQEAEAHRPERGEHERAASPERRVERVAPGTDHRREGQRKHAFRAKHEPDQRPGAREPVQQRRQVRSRRRDREGETERPEAERPEEAAADFGRTRRDLSGQLRQRARAERPRGRASGRRRRPRSPFARRRRSARRRRPAGRAPNP